MATQRSVCLHTVCNVRCRLQSGHLDTLSWDPATGWECADCGGLLPGSEPSGPGSTIPCQRLDRAAGAARPQRHSRPPPRPGQPTNPRKIFTPTPSFSHRSFYVSNMEKSLQPSTLPSCHSRSLSPFRTFLLLRDFSRNKFRLDNIKAEDRAGWKSQFSALKENYPFSVSLQFCHIIVVLSWGADKIWFNGNSGEVKFYDIRQFW